MKKNERAAAIVRTIVVSLIAVLFVVPLVWMVLSSLKTAPEVFARPFHWLPARVQWQNYATVWMNEEASMLRAFANTLYIALFSIIGQMFISSLAAYSFAKINFKGKQVVFMLFLSSMMVPSQLTIIPRFMLFKTIGLYNNLWAIILPAFFGATSIFMLRQFYMGLPNDLIEAAKIDGAGHLRIFLRIMLPLTKAALMSLIILAFISSWNEYMAPLIFLVKKELYTVSQNIQWYMLDEFKEHNLTMAAATSAIVPVVILFIVGQKYFVEGIATSGVKG
ncbi:MAG: carbohydrate ABC transporter permease [Clostridiales bacterium]|nr:carbohydrate ABC transporter permease [Eubacteriales bacterium]MCI5767174.1 carbohydrate ABC transporter permease [Clostridiales bacterium]MDD7122944.1 carbohydrate ABC transporter permease [Clostridiales bacterium]MDY5469790.1 carbohydrate ABC transporter permease [Eubacteriales bacterium]